MTIGTTDLTQAAEARLPADIVTPASARALFWRPRFLRASESLPHLPFLFWLIDSTRPGVFAEIGVGDGVSYFAACQAMDRLGGGGRCLGVCDGALPDELAAYNAAQYDEFSTLRSGTGRALAGQVADGSVDLLSLRALPDEALIAALADEWPRRLSARGVIVLHGVADWPTGGPARLWLDKIGLQHPVISFEEGRGLVAVLVGPDQPEKLADLAALPETAPGAGEVRHVFRRLGAAIGHEWEAGDSAARARAAQDRAEAAEAALAEARARQDAVDAELVSLRESHATQEREALVLKARLEATDAVQGASGMADVLRQHSAAQTELGNLRARLAEAETRADASRRAEDAARADVDSAGAALRAAEAEAADRVAAKERALQQVTAELGVQRAAAEARRAAAEDGQRAQNALRALTQQLEAGREDRDAVNRSLQALKVAHAALRAEADHLRAERDAARADADALANSTFWKLTSPARRIVDGLRRLRGG